MDRPPSDSSSGQASRVLVIGLDGATYDVLAPLAELGVMPNLARLMKSAALAELRSTRPYITPVAWTTFLTGCDPATHGVLDYRYLDHRGRRLRLNQATNIGCPTLFDAVSAAGGEVVSLNLPMTFPAAASTRGLVIGGLDSPSIEAALAPYPTFAAGLRSSNTRFNLSTVWKQRPTTFEELSAGVLETQADFRGRVAAAALADSLHDWRLMIVQFQTLDALQHRCWHLLGLDETTTSPAAWVDHLRAAFRTLDECLGELLELAERRGAAAMVVSDHGFGTFRGKISLPTLLARRGLLQTSSRAGQAGLRLARLPWKARKWLWRRLRPGASTAAIDRPLASLLPIDWRRSTAVTLHGNLAALAYLNTPQRFGGGPLTTPRLLEQATADLLACFREATHPESGEPLFEDVWSVAERWDIDPLERHWPDVVAIPSPGFHTRSKLDGASGLMLGDEQLSGTHRLEGVLMMAGSRQPATHCRQPAARLAVTGTAMPQAFRAELRDVAPTVLHLMGTESVAPMEGRVLHDLMSVGSTPLPAARQRPADTAAPAAVSTVEQETVEARLRDLGYLD